MLAGASKRGLGLCLQRWADSREKPLSGDCRQSPRPCGHSAERTRAESKDSTAEQADGQVC